MNKKTNLAKKPAFTLQLGTDIISLYDTKTSLVKIYSEVGLTDWEIHLNKTNYLEHKTTPSPEQNMHVTSAFEAKKALHQSDYWLS